MTGSARTTGTAAGIIRQARELRRLREWTAADLADAMREQGHDWSASKVANMENGRRQRISTDEVLALARVFGVAPVHLMVPIDEAEIWITPTVRVSTGTARRWIAGEDPAGADPYWWNRHRPIHTGGAAPRAVGGGAKVVERGSEA